MNYEEFKSKDIHGLYTSWVSIEVAHDLDVLPEPYYSIIPKKCKCGSDYLITTNLKTIRCSDPYCPYKLAHRLALMLSDFGCKDIGFSTCFDLCRSAIKLKRFSIPSHIEVMKLEPDDIDLQNSIGSKWYILIDFLTKLKSTRMTFSEVISKLHIPGFGSNAMQVFDEIDSIVDLMKLEEGEGIRGYLNRKGVQSEILIKTLIDNLMAIYTFEYSLNVPLIRTGVLSNKICVTGSVSVDGYSLSRDQFIKYCNALGTINGVQILTVIDSSAMTTCDRIIADKPSNSRKYRAGLSRMKNGEEGILITAQEYVDEIKEMMTRFEIVRSAKGENQVDENVEKEE